MPTRINKFVAQATGLSRRAADQAIREGRVAINQRAASLGDSAETDDKVTLDNRPITPAVKTVTIMLNKPIGYVCSRQGQGSQTIYDLLPAEYRTLKPAGRLDKDSSGLLILTNDGDLANQLTHPRYQKLKIYEVELDKPLQPLHQQMIADHGVSLDDGSSKFEVLKISNLEFRVFLKEGRNRQIRRTFAALGYRVTALRRTQVGTQHLGDLQPGRYQNC